MVIGKVRVRERKRHENLCREEVYVSLEKVFGADLAVKIFNFHLSISCS